MIDFTPFKKRVLEIKDWLSKEYLGIRTGRATPALLDAVLIESYGARQPIKHVAQVSIEDAKTLRIVPWDKANTKAIETAIAAGNLGVSTAADSMGLRVIFPDLTEETRKKFAKLVRDKLEEARVSLKMEREKLMSSINALDEDSKFKSKEELQKLVDQAHLDFEELSKKKEQEVMSV